MKCTKCDGNMFQKVFGDRIAVDRCDRCYGIFCSAAMLERILSEDSSDVILDRGSPDVGKKYSELRGVRCPACHHKMITYRDKSQPRIKLDRCGACDSVFLDAGELTDLKHRTVVEILRKLLGVDRTDED